MGTVDSILEDLKTITKTMVELEDDDTQGWKDLLKLIQRSRKDIHLYMNMPSVVRNLQDKKQPKR